MAISSSGWSSPRSRACALQLLDLLADGAGFFLRVPGAGDLHLLAEHVLGAQRLAEPAFVVRDQVAGGGEDVAGAAVVALEADDLGAGEVVIEAQDVVDLRAAPAVDRLVVIADAADVFGVALCAFPLRASDTLGGAPSPAGERAGARREAGRRESPSPHPARSARHASPRRGEGTWGAARAQRRSSAPAAAATDTARRSCPDTRRPGCI